MQKQIIRAKSITNRYIVNTIRDRGVTVTHSAKPSFDVQIAIDAYGKRQRMLGEINGRLSMMPKRQVRALLGFVRAMVG